MPGTSAGTLGRAGFGVNAKKSTEGVAIMARPWVLALVVWPLTATYAQQVPDTTQSADSASQPATSVSSLAQQPMPTDPNQIAGPPDLCSTGGPCIKPYQPPPPQPTTTFNWDKACGSLTTEGALVSLVPGGQGFGAGLGAVGSACKVAVSAATDGLSAGAAQTGKELISTGADTIATQYTGSELVGRLAGQGTDAVMDAGQALAAAPGDASFNCAKVGQCASNDQQSSGAPSAQQNASTNSVAPAAASAPDYATATSALESDLGIQSSVPSTTTAASAPMQSTTESQSTQVNGAGATSPAANSPQTAVQSASSLVGIVQQGSGIAKSTNRTTRSPPSGPLLPNCAGQPAGAPCWQYACDAGRDSSPSCARMLQKLQSGTHY